MTAQEAHIELDLGLQRINSFDTSELLPQEKDWFINNEVLKFIKQRTNPKSNSKGEGFEDTTKRLEDVKDLITTQPINVQFIGNNKGLAVLPANFLNYISSESTLYDICQSPNLIETKKHRFVFNINPATGLQLSAPVTESLVIALERTNGSMDFIFDSTELPSGYITNYNVARQRFLMVNAVLIKATDKLKEMSPNLLLYRQNYGEEFYNDSFILETPTTIKTVKVWINGILSNINPVVITTNGYSISALRTTNEGVTSNTITKDVKNRITEHEFLPDVRNSVLSKSTASSVISSLRKGIIEVNFPQGYVIPKLNLTYVCKPAKMDILLNRNLNFELDVCKEIIDNTVRYLKAVLSDNNYQAYIQENSLIE